MSWRETNVWAAAERGDIATLRRLLLQQSEGWEGPRRVDIPDICGRTALIKASAQGRTNIVAELLRHEPSLDTQDQHGLTALMVSSYNGHADIVLMLLQAGASVDVKTPSGRTALHKAAYFGHQKICDHLMKFGADINSINSIGGTPIISAAFNGHDAVVRCLAKNGAELGHRNDSRKRAVDYCKTFSLRKYLLAEERWRRRRFALWLSSSVSGGSNIVYNLPEDISRYIATML